MPSADSSNCLSTPFGATDLRLLTELLQAGTPFYVRMQTSPFEARVAYLLNQLVQGERKQRSRYFVFFGSSTSEALSGALKIVRHHRLVVGPQFVNTTTAVFDPSGTLRLTFDPLRQGVDEALVPGLVYFDTIAPFLQFVDRHGPASALLRHAGTLSSKRVDDILRNLRQCGVDSILDESSTDLSEKEPLSATMTTMPDAIIFGENLANHRVPTGCVMMGETVYKIWNNYKNYNLHSNTWGGNSVSLSFVLDFLKTTPGYQKLAPHARKTLQAAAASHTTASRLYARYCNPKMATMLATGGMNKDILSARGTHIRIAAKRGPLNVLDASGTFGLNLRGHNPEDIAADVLARHDQDHDYWLDLEKLLRQKTGLPHLLPAVSGSTAIESAMTMALLAGFPRKKVIALRQGYSGKTLIALAETDRDHFKRPFGPLYPHVVHIDPFADNIQQELLRHVDGQDVALVILETIQGDGGIRVCPKIFFDTLNQGKEKYGYRIAVDEVQTGVYKTGRFLNYQRKIEAPDLVILGKAMSDNLFPVAGTLVSEEIYQQACAHNKEIVNLYGHRYRCQLGAHVALHAIEMGDRLGLAEHAQSMGNYFQTGLKEITRNFDWVKEVRGEGLMIGMEFGGNEIPAILRGSYAGLFAARCANDPVQPVLVAVNPSKPLLIRYLPPLCIVKSEIDAILDTTQRTLKCGWARLLGPIGRNTLKARLWPF